MNVGVACGHCGGDGFRTAIANALADKAESMYDDVEAVIAAAGPDLAERAASLLLADAVLAMLADPVHRLAILNLIGDVHKGRWVANPIDPPGYGHVKVTPDGVQSPWHGFDVLVVRPRGETTDA